MGGSDDRLIAICKAEFRFLFTLDLDFADIATTNDEVVSQVDFAATFASIVG